LTRKNNKLFLKEGKTCKGRKSILLHESGVMLTAGTDASNPWIPAETAVKMALALMNSKMLLPKLKFRMNLIRLIIKIERCEII
jgi:hypothetical protein